MPERLTPPDTPPPAQPAPSPDTGTDAASAELAGILTGKGSQECTVQHFGPGEVARPSPAAAAELQSAVLDNRPGEQVPGKVTDNEKDAEPDPGAADQQPSADAAPQDNTDDSSTNEDGKSDRDGSEDGKSDRDGSKDSQHSRLDKIKAGLTTVAVAVVATVGSHFPASSESSSAERTQSKDPSALHIKAADNEPAKGQGSPSPEGAAADTGHEHEVLPEKLENDGSEVIKDAEGTVEEVLDATGIHQLEHKSKDDDDGDGKDPVEPPAPPESEPSDSDPDLPRDEEQD